MTLPRGFGSNSCYTCRDGRRNWISGEFGCDNPKCPDYREEREPTFSEKHTFEVVIGGILLVIALLVIGVFMWVTAIEADLTITYRNIEGYNCHDLAEYVADRSEHYRYAEHRYEWLCVNEQVKEFQV